MNPIKTNSTTPAIKAEKATTIINWPSLSFGGIIKNQKSGKQLAIVKINGQENIMREGDTIEGILLLKVSMDYIEVSFEKEKKIVSKMDSKNTIQSTK